MTDDEQQSDESLASTFRAAESLREQINNGSTPSNAALPELVKLYTKAADLVSRLSLFSPNETLEDISSSELQYFLIDYYLAETLFKQPSEGGAARREVVLTSRETWERFLRRIDNYELLSKQDTKLLERYLDNKDDFEVGGGLDAAGRRQVKISRYQEEKTLKNKLAQLRDSPRIATATTTTTIDDDDTVRTLHLSHIALRVHETFQNLEFASLELQMLKLAPPSDSQTHNARYPAIQDERERRAQTQEDYDYDDRLDLGHRLRLTDKTGPILDKSGKPLRPFTLLDKRLQLQDGVFRPDHSLPTMSIDEYLAEEKRRGGIIEGGGAASGVRHEVDPDDYAKGEEETMKARQWDDFKEDNPRGSGNTINRG